MNNIVTIKGQTSYLIKSGKADVFLVPVCKEKPMSQMFVGTAYKGITIPGLSLREEIDGAQVDWCFMIKPDEAAEITAVPELEDVYKAFLSGIGYERKASDSEESITDMCACLREDYFYIQQARAQAVRDSKEKNKGYFAESARTVLSAFTLSKENRSARNASHKESLYSAMSFLCEYTKIDLVPFEKLTKCCSGYTIEDIARLSGFDIREVKLPKDFRTSDIGPLIAFIGEDKRPVVLTRAHGKRRHYYDPEDGEIKTLNEDKAKEIDEKAYQIYRPIGDDIFNGKAFFKFALRELSVSDFIMVALGMLLVTGISLAISYLNEIIYDKMIPQGDINNLYAYGGVLISFMVASLLFSIARSNASFRLNSKLKYSLQASIYGRIFRMQENFYRNKDAGELAYRVGILSGCYIAIFNSVVSVVMQLAFSMFYLHRMFRYSTQLGTTGLLVSLISAAAAAFMGFLFQTLQSRRSQLTGKKRAFLYQIFSGISTIRMAGAEDIVLNKYMKREAEFGSADYEFNYIQRISSTINLCAGAISTVIIYSQMSTGLVGMSIGSFMGFISVYSFFSSSFLNVANGVMTIFRMSPVLKNSSDILRTPPESAAKGQLVSELKGKIDVSHVTFAYDKSSAPVLRDISFSIAPGEYIGIVGSSGCGKSTLLRLLLGFDKPSQGNIFYDNTNMKTMNMVQLRRNFGVVLQDGGLFGGSIYSNIKIASPEIGEKEIKEAMEIAELEDVIRDMPMGLMTPVSETSHGLSGGQKQRILIARAVAKKPKILIFDEATSALDNVTQAKVCDNIAALNATRIVVAHRLSTVMKCDRILVLDKGRIVECGNYQELVDRKGLFYELVKNQML